MPRIKIDVFVNTTEQNATPLTGLASLSARSYNTAYTAHFVRPNFGYAETSYMLKTLYKIQKTSYKDKNINSNPNIGKEEPK